MRRCDVFSLKLSEVLDRRRRELDMTQLRLSASADLTPDTVGDALDGRTCRTSTIARLADALDCELVVLLKPRNTATLSRIQ